LLTSVLSGGNGALRGKVRQPKLMIKTIQQIYALWGNSNLPQPKRPSQTSFEHIRA
jgi:hypothetical protein